MFLNLLIKLTITFSLFTSLAQAENSSILSKNYEDNDMWPLVKEEYLGKTNVIFNNEIKIVMQDLVEEPHEVSMIIKIPDNLKNTKEFVVLVDNNPIQLVSRIFPHRNIETVGMNIRLEQNSPVRAAILDDKGVWNVGTKMVYVSSPGGCSLPACDPTIEKCTTSEIGKVTLRKYKRSAGAWRVKLKITHPMDTGLVKDLSTGLSIPEHFINWIYFKDETGPIADAQTYGALSADPVILLDFSKEVKNISVNATDSNGTKFGNNIINSF